LAGIVTHWRKTGDGCAWLWYTQAIVLMALPIA
jgi:hypothetical protein